MHHPLYQHRRRDDGQRARARLGVAEAHVRPHFGGSARHLPRVLRAFTQTYRDGRVGVTKKRIFPVEHDKPLWQLSLTRGVS